MFVVAHTTSESTFPAFHSISDSFEAASRVCTAKCSQYKNNSWFVLKATVANGRIIASSDHTVKRHGQPGYYLNNIATKMPTLNVKINKERCILHHDAYECLGSMPMYHATCATSAFFSTVNRTTTSDVLSTVTTIRPFGILRSSLVGKPKITKCIRDAPLTIAKYTSPLYALLIRFHH